MEEGRKILSGKKKKGKEGKVGSIRKDKDQENMEDRGRKKKYIERQKDVEEKSVKRGSQRMHGIK